MPLVENTPRGLYCAAGDFYIDPWKCDASMRAVITHAHSDHARVGCASYLCSPSCAPILRARLGSDIVTQCLQYGINHELRIGDAAVALLPAGHVRGSAMVRVRRATGSDGSAGAASAAADDGGTWLLTGDYKLTADGVSEPAELCPCDTFVTESTFGLPIFRWKPEHQLRSELNSWWQQCQLEGRTAVVFCYSLGKAQRILAMANPSIGPLFAHGAPLAMNEACRLGGATLPETLHATADVVVAAAKSGRPGLVVAPQSTDGSAWLKKLGETARAAASGWMAVRGTRRRANLDRGFVVSDHADWPQLMEACRVTGARRIGVTHGYTGALSRFLAESGKETFELETRFSGETAAPAPREADDPVEGD